MDEQKFAIAVADKYRQTFNFDFCQDGTNFKNHGSQPKNFISDENLIRPLSCAHAVFTALEFLGLKSQFYGPEKAILFLFLYKQIIYRTERQRIRCDSFAQLDEINRRHIADLEALQKAINSQKRTTESLPAGVDWITSVVWFFQQERPFDFQKAIYGTSPSLNI